MRRSVAAPAVSVGAPAVAAPTAAARSATDSMVLPSGGLMASVSARAAQAGDSRSGLFVGAQPWGDVPETGERLLRHSYRRDAGIPPRPPDPWVKAVPRPKERHSHEEHPRQDSRLVRSARRCG